MKPAPFIVIPLGLAITISARRPPTSVYPRSALGWVLVTSLRITLAGFFNCVLPTIFPPSWVSTKVLLELLRIRPDLSTLKRRYLLCDNPCAFGFAILTMSTPFAALSRLVPVVPSTSTPEANTPVEKQARLQASKMLQLRDPLLFSFRSIEIHHIAAGRSCLPGMW